MTDSMNSVSELLRRGPRPVTAGVDLFAETLVQQGLQPVSLAWTPPARGNLDLLSLLNSLDQKMIQEANSDAVNRILSADPVLIGIETAKDIIPGMTEEMFLHAGPPIGYERMCGPMKGAVWGCLMLEGLAEGPEEADDLARSGKIHLDPCHNHCAVGPMTGLVAPSMPVFVIENRKYGNKAFVTLNEGLGKVLRFGAYDSGVLARLRWMEDVLAPVLKDAISSVGSIPLSPLIAQALTMGDELHNRNVAGTLLFLKAVTPGLLDGGHTFQEAKDVFSFIAGNGHFFLNISMGTCKATMDPASGIRFSSIVTAMARNGVNFGIRVSGCGDRWFEAPAEVPPDSLFFPGFGPEDANADLGDSTITETAGLGAFALPAAPAIVQFVGGKASEAVARARSMGRITATRHSAYHLPYLDFEGTPTGIDVLKVIASGETPFLNTGIAHHKPGIGQIGAGVLTAPWLCFEKALRSLADSQ